MNEPVSISDVLLRVLATVLISAIIGWERERHGRPAGLRTTVLTGTASALAMILSQIMFFDSATAGDGVTWRPDPARLGAGILTGIGFLGAGTILRHDTLIRGVTTAASLWFVTVLGLVFGSGEFVLGAVGAAVALLALLLIPALEKHIQTDWYATFTVTLELDALNEEELRLKIKAHGVKVKAMEFSYDLAVGRKTVTYEVKTKRKAAFAVSTKLLAELRGCPGVLQVKWT